MPIRFVDNAAGNHCENSPAIHRWEEGISSKPSLAGTEETFLSERFPCGAWLGQECFHEFALAADGHAGEVFEPFAIGGFGIRVQPLVNVAI